MSRIKLKKSSAKLINFDKKDSRKNDKIFGVKNFAVLIAGPPGSGKST